MLNFLFGVALFLSATVRGSVATETLDLPGRLYGLAESNSPYFKTSRQLKDFDHKVDFRSPSQILQRDFVDPKSGRLRPEALDLKIQEITDTEREAFRVACQESETEFSVIQCGGALFDNASEPSYRKASKFIKKWSKDKVHVGYEYARVQLKKAQELMVQLQVADFRSSEVLNSTTAQPMLHALFQGLEAYQATLADTSHQATLKDDLHNYIRILFGDVKIERRREALDLVMPRTSAIESSATRFLNPATLKSGEDTSLYDPAPGAIWAPPQRPISEYDTSNYDGRTVSEVGPAMLDISSEPKLWFDKQAQGRGGTPKFTATDETTGLNFKVKILVPVVSAVTAPEPLDVFNLAIANNLEVKTETAANSLLEPLGFRVDPTYYHHKARLYVQSKGLPSEPMTALGCKDYNKEFDENVRDMLEKVTTVFPRDPYQNRTNRSQWDYPGAFQVRKVDERGCKYIELNQVSLERRPHDGYQKIGFANRASFGHSDQRAYRALSLFQFLINDIDTTDWNTSIYVTPAGLKNVISDMGFSFGMLALLNRPNYYSPHFIDFEKSKFRADGEPESIVIKYKGPNLNAVSDSLNMSDAKWFGRLIGQLTVDQVRKAFRFSGHPPVVVEMYTQHFLSRRDELLKALGLFREKSGSFKPLSLVTDSKHNYVAPEFRHCYEADHLTNACFTTEDPNHNYSDYFNLQLKPNEGTSAGQILAGIYNHLAILGSGQVAPSLQHIKIAPEALPGRVQVGMTGIIPVRVQVPNPFGDIENPFWVVDLYSCAFGVEKTADLEKFKNSASVFDKIRASGGISDVRSFAVVRPFKKGYVEALKAYEVLVPSDIARNCGQFIKSYSSIVTKKLIEQTQHNEFIIAGNDLVVGGSIGQSPTQIMGQGLVVSAGAQFVSAKKLLLYKVVKGQNDKSEDPRESVLASWVDTTRWVARPVDLSARALLLKFPIFSSTFAQSGRTQRTFNIPWIGPDGSPDIRAQKILMDNISEDVPRIPAEYHGFNKYTKTKFASWLWSFFGLATKTSSKESSIGTYTALIERGNSEPSEVVLDRIASFVRQKNITTSLLNPKTWLSPSLENLVRVQTTSTSSGRPIARVNFDYVRSYARAKDMQGLQNGLLRLLPSFYGRFDVTKGKEYFNLLELHGYILFSEVALDKIMQFSPEKACQTFVANEYFPAVPKLPAQVSGGLTPQEYLCKFVQTGSAVDDVKLSERVADSRQAGLLRESLMATREFVSRFKQLHELYTPMDSVPDKFLRKLDDLLNQQALQHVVVNTLIDISGLEGIYRDARIYSTHEGLPNQERITKLNPRWRGGLSHKEVAALNERFETVRSNADVVLDEMGNFAFDYLRINNLTSGIDGDRYHQPHRAWIRESQSPKETQERRQQLKK